MPTQPHLFKSSASTPDCTLGSKIKVVALEKCCTLSCKNLQFGHCLALMRLHHLLLLNYVPSGVPPLCFSSLQGQVRSMRCTALQRDLLLDTFTVISRSNFSYSPASFRYKTVSVEIRVPEKYKQDEAFHRMNLDGEKKYLASISFDREYHEYITPAYFLPTSVDVEESYLCV